MTAAWNPAEAARLVAELREDDARMTPGPWWAGQDLLDTEGPWWIQSGVDIVARVGDPREEGRTRAAGIARLRNNAKPFADQLEAAMARVGECESAVVALHLERERLQHEARDHRDIIKSAQAEVDRLKRELKHVTYYEITDDAITMLTDRLEAESAGTPLGRLALDAATNIRQLQQQNARAIDASKKYIAQRDEMMVEAGRLRAEVERLTARHDSSMRYLRDVENMASTGTQTAVTREDADGTLRLAIFRDIRTAARAAIAGDGLLLNEAMEIERLRSEVASMQPVVEAAEQVVGPAEQPNAFVLRRGTLAAAVHAYRARKT